jgi:hypothetical protein
MTVVEVVPLVVTLGRPLGCPPVSTPSAARMATAGSITARLRIAGLWVPVSSDGAVTRTMPNAGPAEPRRDDSLVEFFRVRAGTVLG